MKLSFSFRALILLGTVAAGTVAGTRTSLGDDWKQWNGPKRTGEYNEPGIIQSIPAAGLTKLWSAPIAGGYSGPSVANGRVYVTDYVKKSGESTNNPGGRDKLTGTERIACFDARSGKNLWIHSYDRPYDLSYAAGPRVTPTIDGESVYALGAEGDLICLNATTGSVLWQRQLKEEYKTESPLWGFAAAPLILGDQLITLAGGEGSLVVSLDKKTGKEIWRSLSGKDIGYCPPSLIRAAGTDQLLIWEPKALHGLSPRDGKILWSTPLEPKYEMSITPPVISGDLMYVSGIGEVGQMFRIRKDKPGVDVLWKGDIKNAVYCSNSTPVFEGEYLYGCDCGKGPLICVRASDGQRMWETFQPTAGGDRRASHGTAFLSKVGDRFFILSETGDFIIAKLSPEKYEEIGRQPVIEPTNDCFGRKVVWSYPAYADRCLFVRNDKELTCYSLAAPSSK
jgi:outer membrane protein assembly factor BamB